MSSTYSFLSDIRPALLASLLKQLLGVQRVHAATKKGLTFWVDPVSHFGSCILNQGQYEPELTEFIECILRPQDTFIDVGANEGYFSAVASTQVGAGKVYSIEPQSRLQNAIKRNLELNRCKNVSLVRLALADYQGESILHLSPDTNTGSSSLKPNWKFGGSKETVVTLTLDDFVEKHSIGNIRAIKLDCEGAEYPILKGAEKTLADQKVDFWIVEYHSSIVGEFVTRRIDQTLRGSGYTVSQIHNGLWVYHLPRLASDLNALGPLKEIAAL